MFENEKRCAQDGRLSTEECGTLLEFIERCHATGHGDRIGSDLIDMVRRLMRHDRFFTGIIDLRSGWLIPRAHTPPHDPVEGAEAAGALSAAVRRWAESREPLWLDVARGSSAHEVREPSGGLNTLAIHGLADALGRTASWYAFTNVPQGLRHKSQALLAHVVPHLHQALHGRPPSVRRRTVQPPRPGVTPRERDVLVQLREGRSSPGIARALNISVATARSHVQNILMKLGAANRAQAVAIALDECLLPPRMSEAPGARLALREFRPRDEPSGATRHP